MNPCFLLDELGRKATEFGAFEVALVDLRDRVQHTLHKLEGRPTRRTSSEAAVT